jgi:hypothetical protein
LLKKRGLVKLYAAALFIHLFVSVGTGAFFIYSLYHSEGQQELSNCENGSSSTGNSIDDLVCKGALGVVRAVSITVLILEWIIELCMHFPS